MGDAGAQRFESPSVEAESSSSSETELSPSSGTEASPEAARTVKAVGTDVQGVGFSMFGCVGATFTEN